MTTVDADLAADTMALQKPGDNEEEKLRVHPFRVPDDAPPQTVTGNVMYNDAPVLALRKAARSRGLSAVGGKATLVHSVYRRRILLLLQRTFWSETVVMCSAEPQAK